MCVKEWYNILICICIWDFVLDFLYLLTVFFLLPISLSMIWPHFELWTVCTGMYHFPPLACAPSLGVVLLVSFSTSFCRHVDYVCCVSLPLTVGMWITCAVFLVPTFSLLISLWFFCLNLEKRPRQNWARLCFSQRPCVALFHTALVGLWNSLVLGIAVADFRSP